MEQLCGLCNLEIETKADISEIAMELIRLIVDSDDRHRRERLFSHIQVLKTLYDAIDNHPAVLDEVSGHQEIA